MEGADWKGRKMVMKEREKNGKEGRLRNGRRWRGKEKWKSVKGKEKEYLELKKIWKVRRRDKEENEGRCVK